ncbi:S8 family peptidase [Nonomuraea soli]|uniref:Subtilisin family serine protease n=1 Tax=Nonomuraea soli TaxID=1032476 RepID=A0A7W0HVC8_9ACTN|nr:S8/S53 family peptidase [Nonomuraea soli]MBA2896681.1 subtilisin family serine protease [Nonomuraea soli]
MDVQAVGSALIRSGQILLDRSAVSAVSRWTQAIAEADGVCVVRLSPGVDPCELTQELRDQGYRASPNHVLTGQPLFFGGPASRPFPTGEIRASLGRERSGVRVALLDTGVAAHPWWAKSRWYGSLGEAAADAVEGEQAGHGTFIAGLLLRRAPEAGLQVIRVLDGDGSGDEARLLRALHRLRGERAPQVVNLSLGGHTFDDQPSPLLADAVGALPDTVVVACAGNTASDRPFWPAALPGVIGVGALDAAEQRRAAFSGHGPWVDAWARGEWLASSFLSTGDFSGYATWSGTSFAAALVSGAIAAGAADAPVREAAAAVLGDRQIPDLGALVTARL